MAIGKPKAQNPKSDTVPSDKKCPKCKTPGMYAAARFCHRCGHTLEAATSSAFSESTTAELAQLEQVTGQPARRLLAPGGVAYRSSYGAEIDTEARELAKLGPAERNKRTAEAVSAAWPHPAESPARKEAAPPLAPRSADEFLAAQRTEREVAAELARVDVNALHHLWALRDEASHK
jgi:hypothetical protein